MAQNNSCILIVLCLVLLAYFYGTLKESFIPFPSIDIDKYSNKYYAKKCTETHDLLNQTGGYINRNCDSAPLQIPRNQMNKGLDCRYYDDQQIFHGINEDSWCHLDNEYPLDLTLLSGNMS